MLSIFVVQYMTAAGEWQAASDIDGSLAVYFDQELANRFVRDVQGAGLVRGDAIRVVTCREVEL